MAGDILAALAMRIRWYASRCDAPCTIHRRSVAVPDLASIWPSPRHPSSNLNPPVALQQGRLRPVTSGRIPSVTRSFSHDVIIALP